MKKTSSADPRQGEIRWADMEPIRGQELNKTRPVLVLSGDSYRALALRLVAPITGLTPAKSGKTWLVPLHSSAETGLAKESVADVLQVRALSLGRFDKQLGRASAADLEEVVAGLMIVVEPE
ncbi:MAG: type II toxin-antitoxin system PemK/MazF family toxin [Coriobacteriia bacterium]|nr:type II toxin-antitoxin system PemK/MazF family toxin [Coriobacteriia bacterium]